MKMVFTFFIYFLMSSELFAQDSTNSYGDCSPNSGYVMNSTFICFNKNLTQEDQELLREIKRSLEQISVDGGPAQRNIILKLNSIANQSGDRYAEIVSFYRNLQRDISSIPPQLSRIEVIVSKLDEKIFSYVPQPLSSSPPPPNLDTKVDISHLVLSEANKSLQAVISESQCKSLNFDSQIAIKNVDLMKLIVKTESMECEEKQYWHDLLPSMNDSQISRLREILETEEKKLNDLEEKYQGEIFCLNIKHKFSQSYKKIDSGVISIEQTRNAVTYLEEKCSSYDLVNETIESLVSTDPFILAADPERSYLLSKVYSTEKYNNKQRRVALIKLAYERNPNVWNYFSEFVRFSIGEEDWRTVFELTKSAIGRNLMPEFQANSKEDIGKKLLIYWWYLFSSTKLGETIDVNKAAITGYNLTKILLEREPSENLISKIAFFSGHIWRSNKIDPKLKDEYFLAILRAAQKLKNSGSISKLSYADIMLNISWYCLIARAPNTALRAAQEGLKVAPGKTVLYTNLAHAYLMLGQQKEAYNIYRKFSGQHIEGRVWDDVIIDDFHQLQKLDIHLVKNPDDRGIFNQKRNIPK